MVLHRRGAKALAGLLGVGLLLLAGFLILHSLTYAEEWMDDYAAFESGGDAVGLALAPCGDGGAIVVGGLAASSDGDEWDLLVLRLDRYGNLLWRQTLLGSEFGLGEGVTGCMDGTDHFFVAGTSYAASGEGNDDAFALCMDGEGNLIWSHTYGGGGDDRCHGVASCPGGGVLLVGSTSSSTGGDQEAWALRLDEEGQILWNLTYGGEGEDWFWGAAANGDGFLLVGATESNGEDSFDVLALYVNSTGDVQWARSYGGPGRDEGCSATSCPGGGFLIAGLATVEGEERMLALRIDQQGNQMWNTTHGGLLQEAAQSVVLCQDGGFLLTGYGSPSPLIAHWELLILRLNAQGDILWSWGYACDPPSWSLEATVHHGWFAAAPSGGQAFLLAGSARTASPSTSQPSMHIWALRLLDTPHPNLYLGPPLGACYLALTSILLVVSSYLIVAPPKPMRRWSITTDTPRRLLIINLPIYGLLIYLAASWTAAAPLSYPIYGLTNPVNELPGFLMSLPSAAWIALGATASVTIQTLYFPTLLRRMTTRRRRRITTDEWEAIIITVITITFVALPSLVNTYEPLNVAVTLAITAILLGAALPTTLPLHLLMRRWELRHQLKLVHRKGLTTTEPLNPPINDKAT